MRLIDANLIEEIFKEQGYDYCAGVVYCTPTIDIDSIITEHENIGYEKGFRDGYAKAVDVKPTKHGYWTKVGDNSHKCSICDEISCCAGYYCPDCGAKMDEIKE